MLNVKHITKVAGVIIIVANVKKHPIIINAAKANEINAYLKDFSLDRQLNIERK